MLVVAVVAVCEDRLGNEEMGGAHSCRKATAADTGIVVTGSNLGETVAAAVMSWHNERAVAACSSAPDSGTTPAPASAGCLKQ